MTAKFPGSLATLSAPSWQWTCHSTLCETWLARLAVIQSNPIIDASFASTQTHKHSNNKTWSQSSKQPASQDVLLSMKMVPHTHRNITLFILFIKGTTYDRLPTSPLHMLIFEWQQAGRRKKIFVLAEIGELLAARAGRKVRSASY